MSHATLSPSPLLRLALLADAASSGAMGLLLVAAAGPLAGLLGLPETLLRVVGLVFLPWALAVAWLGTRSMPPRRAVQAVIAVNLVWVADSLLLLALGPALAGVAPNGLGVAFVLAQALAVLGLAVAQAIGLRRAGAAALPAYA